MLKTRRVAAIVASGVLAALGVGGGLAIAANGGHKSGAAMKHESKKSGAAMKHEGKKSGSAMKHEAGAAMHESTTSGASFTG
jgi:hypothetical protein